MPLEIVCRNCKRPYVPSKGDVLSGVYRLCPECREPKDGDAADEPPAAA